MNESISAVFQWSILFKNIRHILVQVPKVIYFSYGNRATFGIIDSSSVSQYLEKKTTLVNEIKGFY